jgi:hypothetical protein
MSRADHYNRILQRLATRLRAEASGELLAMWWEWTANTFHRGEWEWWMDWRLHTISTPSPDSHEHRHTVYRISQNKDGELFLPPGLVRRCRGFTTEMT